MMAVIGIPRPVVVVVLTPLAAQQLAADLVVYGIRIHILRACAYVVHETGFFPLCRSPAAFPHFTRSPEEYQSGQVRTLYVCR